MLNLVRMVFIQKGRLSYLGLGFSFTLAIKGLEIKHLKTASKWILEERLIVDANFLALLVSYEERKQALLCGLGKEVKGGCAGLWQSLV